MDTDTVSSGRFGNQNYLGTPDGYTELSREVAPPPKNWKNKQFWLFFGLLSYI